MGGRIGPVAAPAPASGGTPPQQQPEAFGDGSATGQTIARYDGRELRADERASRVFGSLDAATAYARSLDTPAAVIEERGRYVVYRLHGERGLLDRLTFGGYFSRDTAAPYGESNVTNVQPVHPRLRALVTTDDFVIRMNGAGSGTLDRIGSPLGPFSSHLQAFGPSLERIKNRGAFERQFEQAMRDSAFHALDNSQRAVEDIRGRLDSQDLTLDDRTALKRTLQRLAPLDRQIADKQREVDGARRDWIGATRLVVMQSEGIRQSPEI